MLMSRVMNGMISLGWAIKCKVAGLASDERGVSSVEFAMLLPLMRSLYLVSV